MQPSLADRAEGHGMLAAATRTVITRIWVLRILGRPLPTIVAWLARIKSDLMHVPTISATPPPPLCHTL